MTSERIEIVKARLELVNKLTNLRESFRGKEEIEHIGEQGWTHPYRHYAALRFYLLLTCFDILGQTDDFMDFYSWLNTNNIEITRQRDRIIEPLYGADIRENIKIIYRKYNEIYGVKNSFRRFVFEILSKKNQLELFKSIIIKKQRISDGKLEEYIPTEKKKTDFLFLIRNSYTHKGESLASAAGGLFLDQGDEDPRIFLGKLLWRQQHIHTEINRKFKYSYFVKKWPSLLVDIINETIS